MSLQITQRTEPLRRFAPPPLLGEARQPRAPWLPYEGSCRRQRLRGCVPADRTPHRTSPALRATSPIRGGRGTCGSPLQWGAPAERVRGPLFGPGVLHTGAAGAGNPSVSCADSSPLRWGAFWVGGRRPVGQGAVAVRQLRGCSQHTARHTEPLRRSAPPPLIGEAGQPRAYWLPYEGSCRRQATERLFHADSTASRTSPALRATSPHRGGRSTPHPWLPYQGSCRRQATERLFPADSTAQKPLRRFAPPPLTGEARVPRAPWFPCDGGCRRQAAERLFPCPLHLDPAPRTWYTFAITGKERRSA